MPHLSDSDRAPPEVQPLWVRLVHEWGALHLARVALARAREDLAAAVKAQPADRHFRGLPESPEVIAAYDAVRAVEGEVARLEREGRTP